MLTTQLVLASTSPFRRELLARLGLPFETADPGTDETAEDGETPTATALRLSEAKARAEIEALDASFEESAKEFADLAAMKEKKNV